MSSATANRRGTIEKVLIGCGAAIVVGLLICAGVAFWAAPRVIKQVQLAVKEAGDFLEREAAREAFLQEWTPPDPTTTADQRFPPQIGAFTRTAEPDEAVLRKFGLVDELPHATYASPEQIVEVYLKPMSDQERRAAYVSLQDALKKERDGKSGEWSTQGSPDTNRFYFYTSPPPRSGWCWWSKGWMAIALTDNDFDPESFLREYLLAIQGTAQGSKRDQEKPSPEDVIENAGRGAASPPASESSGVEQSPTPDP